MTDGAFITISSGDLTARIHTLGAELWSLQDPQGREYMTDADPAFWSGHAPLLFPIIGALNQGRYRLGTQEYAMTKHGFARQSLFTVVESSADQVHLRLRESEATLAAYPFAFVLDVVFRLEGTSLNTTVTVTNPDDTALPFSFGFHPAFAWPLPDGGDKAAHTIIFADPEPQDIRRIAPDSGLVLPHTFQTPVNGHTLTPTVAQFEADALIWDHLNSRAVTFASPNGAKLDIAFPDCPMLGIWQKPQAAYLCIEPWQGIADPQGFDGDFTAKPGVITLPPHESRSFRMNISVTKAH